MVSFLQWPLNQSSHVSKGHSYWRTTTTWISWTLPNVLRLTTSQLQLYLFRAQWLRWHQRFDMWITCWPQFELSQMLSGSVWNWTTWISLAVDFGELQWVPWDANCQTRQKVGTMIGPDGHIHRWSVPSKFIQRVLRINTSTKSLVERLCDFKIDSISVLSFSGSVCAPDKVTLNAETHALLWGSRSRQGSPSPFKQSTQCYYCPQGSGRSARGSAREKDEKKGSWKE